ncbi:MAG: multiheme c-type cytochrome [Kofleriaceae bacterium]
MQVARIALVVLVIAGAAHASRRDWTGTQVCGSCHARELASWKATPHATTQRRFATAPEAKCLACHATGEAPAGPTVAVEVGCEACHGAGAAYGEDDIMRSPAVARALGLVDMATPKARAAVCAQCHVRSTRGKVFDPTAPVHPRP